MSSSRGSDIASKRRATKIPPRLTLRPNETNEVRIGGHRLIITPLMRPTSELPFDDLDPVAKFAPVACELSACRKEDLQEFDARRKLLQPQGDEDRYLERILAIFDALALYGINYGGISKSTIFVDNRGRVYLRGFMRPANLRRLGQDVKDLFGVFSSIIPRYPDFKFYRYLSESFDSVEHARSQFPVPDASFDEITWTKDVHVYQKVSKHEPTLTYVAIGQLCDMLLLEHPSEAASYINKLRELRRARGPGAEFDHCIFHEFKNAFPALCHRRLPRTWYPRVPVLKLTGYGTFVECSRLRLWAGCEFVDAFDRTYADYEFLDVVSDDGSLDGSYAAAKDIPDIIGCLNLPKDPFSSLPRQEEDVTTRPKFLFYLQNISVSLLESSDGTVSWSTGEVDEPRIERSGFAKLVQEKHEYPHIFKMVPRVLLDEFKSTIAREPPFLPEVEEEPSFEYRGRK
ncbi:MAG: hypothetical protein LQ349_005686 [Xanthoria aureola]|nr:MAG: hypothetical protein LQ349_005686 [Xanthoria aureola]